MTDECEPSGLRVDALDSVVEAFIEWAGGPSEVSLLYTPDVLTPVEC